MKNEKCHCQPVRYKWTAPDGTIHSHRSVVIAKTRHGLRAALKRFFILNPHVEAA